jgi:hypothetical protein
MEIVPFTSLEEALKQKKNTINNISKSKSSKRIYRKKISFKKARRRREKARLGFNNKKNGRIKYTGGSSLENKTRNIT